MAMAEVSSAGKTLSIRSSAMVNPSIARRSPAITTPLSNFRARTVVPCGNSTVVEAESD